MKVWIAVIGVFLLILTFGPVGGCGGGTGTTTSTTSTTSTTGNFAYYLVEATKSGVIIDPNNIVQGETVQFDVAGYSATNVRTVLSSSNWALDPTGQLEGTISGSGQFTATASGGQFTLSADANSGSHVGTAQVKAPGQAFITGRLNDGQGNVAHGITVDFYAGNTKVGSAVSQGDGTFRAVVPQTADTFEVNKNTIPAAYYKEYGYNNKWYLPQGACRAPLPSLTNGTTTHITDITVPARFFNGSSLPPPPPPSAC